MNRAGTDAAGRACPTAGFWLLGLAASPLADMMTRSGL